MTDEMISTAEEREERAVVVGADLRGSDRWEILDSLDELAELARSAGAEVVDRQVIRRDRPTPSLFIGEGKARDLAHLCRERGATLVLFDEDLSPVQKRNLERVFRLKILDRTELILDIFAQRARTRAGKLQIELAQLQYLLPRLTRLWTHLSRQQGGIGTRGPGETQLEVDRRRIQERIRVLRRRLEEVRAQRRVVRASRKRRGRPVGALVGYTNAGKSTLLNVLTQANVLAEDKLFATLDPTTRAVRVPGNQAVLLTDTVGFLRKLPPHLVEAFHATLEEVIEADFLVHVVDVSHPKVEDQIRAVEEVLSELGAARKPRITALNKIDLVQNREYVRRMTRRFPSSAAISAKRRIGLNDLLEEMAGILRDRRVRVSLRIPASDGAALARVHDAGQVLTEDYDGATAAVEALLPRAALGDLDRYIEKDGSGES